jgi:hypothetical protein
MFAERKTQTPIDRAIADVQHQIADLERRARETETPASAPHPRDTRDSWKQWFARPTRQSLRTAARSTRRDLFDAPATPLKELQDGAFPFEQQPDLFAQPREKEKLAHFLNAGPMKMRPPLRHVQRKNRQRFYLWLTLGIVVFVLLWLVVH